MFEKPDRKAEVFQDNFHIKVKIHRGKTVTTKGLHRNSKSVTRYKVRFHNIHTDLCIASTVPCKAGSDLRIAAHTHTICVLLVLYRARHVPTCASRHTHTHHLCIASTVPCKTGSDLRIAAHTHTHTISIAAEHKWRASCFNLLRTP